MDFTKEQIEEMLEQRKEENTEVLLDAITSKIGWYVGDWIKQEGQSLIQEFVRDELMPEALVKLRANQAGMIEGIVAAAEEIGELLKKKLVQQATENLASYRSKEIINGLFK